MKPSRKKVEQCEGKVEQNIFDTLKHLYLKIQDLWSLEVEMAKKNKDANQLLFVYPK